MSFKADVVLNPLMLLFRDCLFVKIIIIIMIMMIIIIVNTLLTCFTKDSGKKANTSRAYFSLESQTE